MRAKLRLGICCAAAVVLLVGCGGDDGDDDVDADAGAAGAAGAGAGGDDNGAKAGISIEDLPAQLSARLCTEIESCFEGRSLALLFGDDGCEARSQAQFEDGEFADLMDAVEAKRVDYDPEQAKRCLEDVGGLSCTFGTTRLNSIASCESAFAGHTKVGDACIVNAECEGTAFCLRADKCPGTCSELLGPGETCEHDDDCENGLTCADTGVCSAPAEEGDVCKGNVGAECRAGLACVGADDDKGTAGTCRESASLFTGKLGDSCDYDTGKLCATDLTCIVDSIATGGMPTLLCAKPSASGAACKFGAPNPCPDDEYCDANIAVGDIEGTCKPLPAAGASCLALTGAAACSPGLICDTDMRCHPVNRLGQPCVSDAGCTSKSCVDGSCKRPKTCDL